MNLNPVPRLAVVAAIGAILLGSLDADARPALAGSGASRGLLIRNVGQEPDPTRYYAVGQGAFIAFRAGHVAITEHVGGGAAEASGPRHDGLWARVAVDGRVLPAPDAQSETRTYRLELVGAAPGVEPVGRDRTPTTVSVFRGPRSRWAIGAPAFREVVYPGAWPGVSVVFGVSSEGLTARLEGAPTGAMPDEPLAWRGGQPASAPLQPARPGQLPPAAAATLAFASYFGGPQEDRGLGVAVDGDGSAYVTGHGPSGSRPDDDAFVIKLEPDGQEAAWIAYIGGAALDTGFDVAVDGSGHAYLVGATESSQATFPASGGPDTTYNGNVDTLVAKLSADGRDLVYAGYLGGDGFDFAEGVAVDGAGNAYVTGLTGSLEHSFPVSVGPDVTFNGQPTPDEPDLDAFVAKIVADPTLPDVKENLAYAGYIGGRGMDVGFFPDGEGVFLTAGHVALGPDGSAYVSGLTESTESSFPDGDGFGDLPGPDRTHNGGWDGWAVRVAPDGDRLLWAGFVGGSGEDHAFGMAVDDDGNGYLTGYTESPTLGGAADGPSRSYGGDGDALAARIAADGSRFDYLGYLGGSDPDGGFGVAVGGDGSLTIVGYTESRADSFPVVVGPDLTQNDAQAGAGDAFVCRVKPAPEAPTAADNLAYCGYIGGDGYDQAFWVALDGDGGAYVVGDTQSPESTFPGGDGFGGLRGWKTERPGGTDGFVVKVGAAAPATPTSPPPGPPRLYVPSASR